MTYKQQDRPSLNLSGSRGGLMNYANNSITRNSENDTYNNTYDTVDQRGVTGDDTYNVRIQSQKIVSDKKGIDQRLQNAPQKPQNAPESILGAAESNSPEESNLPDREAPQAGRRPLLGKDSELPVPTHKSDANLARIHRFELQQIARELKPESSVTRCFRVVAFDPVTRRQYDHVAIKRSVRNGNRYLSNLWPCTNVWDCPNCQWLACSRYLQRMEAAITSRPNRARFAYALETFTVGHKAWMEPEAVISGFKKAQAMFRSGRWWQSFRSRWHIRGLFSAPDIICTENGVHPHVHNLVIADKGGFWVDQPDGSPVWIAEHFNERVLAEMFTEAAARWSECCEKAGLYASIEHGYSIEHRGQGEKAIANYLAKMAMEVSLAPAKRGGKSGKTLLELLEAAGHGDQHAGELWIRITDAFKGKALIKASPGLWALLGAVEPTKEDLSAPEGEADDHLLMRLMKQSWYQQLRQGKRHDVIRKVYSDITDNDLVQWFRSQGFELELVESE